MADRAYENAMARRDELARAINEAQQLIEGMRTELRGVDTFLGQWRKFAGVTEPAGVDPALNDIAKPPPWIPKRMRNSKKEDVAEAAYEIIKERGEPMTRSDLYDRLIARGMVLNGSDPQMVLSTMLWRMPSRIKRLKKGGYWLADVPFKGGGVDPYFADPEFDAATGTVDDSPPEGAEGSVESEEEAT
jgi:hypothetical protein